MSTAAGSTATRGVLAEVGYVRNEPGPGSTLEFLPHDEGRSTMRTLPGREVWIEDLRGRATDLDREGFVLVPHISEVGDFDRIEEDAAIDALYRSEMEALLAAVTGADRVVLLGGAKKRYGEAATDRLAPLSNGKPARYPHADNTDASATALVDLLASFAEDLDPRSASRWALCNLWRAVTPPPQDIPLAVCDARTVAPEDEVTVTAITLERGIGPVRHDTTGYRWSPAHRWHYASDMTRDEVLVFKAHDTDPDRAGRVPHTAFTDRTCPAGGPTRASVEARGLALFS